MADIGDFEIGIDDIGEGGSSSSSSSSLSLSSSSSSSLSSSSSSISSSSTSSSSKSSSSASSSSSSTLPYLDISTIESSALFNSLAINPQRNLARASDGTLYCIYSDFDGGTGRKQISIKSSSDDGDTWGSQEFITSEASYDQGRPCVAIDSEDNFHIVWYGKHAGQTSRNQIRYIKGTLGSWGSIYNLTDNGSWDSRPGYIAIDGNNYVHVVYTRAYSIMGESTLYYRKYTTSWQAEETLSETNEPQASPSITIDTNNYVHVVWSGQPSGNTDKQIRYRKYTDSWQSIENLTDESVDQTAPSICIDDIDNSIHVAWRGYYGSDWQVRYIKNDGAVYDSWSSITELTSATGSMDQASVSISIDAQRHLYVAWRGKLYGETEVQLYIREYDTSSWGSIQRITNSVLLQRYPSLIYGMYPIVGESRTNIPDVGCAVTWITQDGNDILFGKHQNLSWGGSSSSSSSSSSASSSSKSSSSSSNSSSSSSSSRSSSSSSSSSSSLSLSSSSKSSTSISSSSSSSSSYSLSSSSSSSSISSSSSSSSLSSSSSSSSSSTSSSSSSSSSKSSSSSSKSSSSSSSSSVTATHVYFSDTNCQFYVRMYQVSGGSAVDETTNGYNLTANSDASGPGQMLDGARLNRSYNEYYSITSGSCPNLGIGGVYSNISIVGRIKLKRNVGSDDFGVVSKHNLTTYNGQYAVVITATASINYLKFILSSDGISEETLTSTIPLSLDTYYNFAVVYNGSQMLIYINGSLDVSNSYSDSINIGTAPFEIGRINQDDVSCADMEIQYIGVFDRVLQG